MDGVFMTAYELADQVEMWGEDLLALNMKGGIPVIEGAKMLRQQAKELDEAGHMIGVLREQLQEEIQARADALDDLNSRMMKFMKSYNEMAYKLEEVGGAYTHPVKEQDTDCQYCKQGCIRCDARKQLTDEEIIAVGNAVVNHIDSNEGWIEFARAILRKASEK
jgi:hypothetical protein